MPRFPFAVVSLALLAATAGCADDAASSTPQPQCAQGQAVDPITGACVSAHPGPEPGADTGQGDAAAPADDVGEPPEPAE